MEEHPSIVVKSEIFNKLFSTQVALFKQIEAKQRIEEATITQEEADFCNACIEYLHELNHVVEEQI